MCPWPPSGSPPYDPRKHFDEQDLADLAESLKRHGVLQPLTARPVTIEGQSASYEIIAGERRLPLHRRATVMTRQRVYS